MVPKDKNTITHKSRVTYRYTFNRIECDEEYVGESARKFGERFKEHLLAPSPLYEHYNITTHQTSVDHFSIVGKEAQNLKRTIMEAIFIRVTAPSLKRNIDKYQLTHIWHEGLFNTPELKLKETTLQQLLVLPSTSFQLEGDQGSCAGSG